MPDQLPKISWVTWLRIIASSCCLWLCFVLIAFWVDSRSYRKGFDGPIGDNHRLMLSMWLGHFKLDWVQLTPRRARQYPHPHKWLRSSQPNHAWQGWFKRMNIPEPDRRISVNLGELTWSVSSPFWIPVLVTGFSAVLLKPFPRRRFSLAEILTIMAILASALTLCFIVSEWIGAYSLEVQLRRIMKGEPPLSP